MTLEERLESINNELEPLFLEVERILIPDKLANSLINAFKKYSKKNSNISAWTLHDEMQIMLSQDTTDDSEWAKFLFMARAFYWDIISWYHLWNKFAFEDKEKKASLLFQLQEKIRDAIKEVEKYKKVKLKPLPRLVRVREDFLRDPMFFKIIKKQEQLDAEKKKILMPKKLEVLDEAVSVTKEVPKAKPGRSQKKKLKEEDPNSLSLF